MKKKITRDEENDARTEYSERIKRLILGPGSESISRDAEREIISENPKVRYVTGILYSEKDSFKGGDADDTAEVEKSGDAIEDPVSVDNNFRASSMGMTFYIKTTASAVEASICTAMYMKILKPFIDINNDLFEQLEQLDDTSFLEFDEKELSVAIKGDTGDQVKVAREKLGAYLNCKLNTLQSPIIRVLKQLNRLSYSYSYNHSFFRREPHMFNIKIDINENNLKKQIVSYKLDDNESINLEIFDKVQILKTKNVGDIKAVTVVMKNLNDEALFQSSITVNAQQNLEFYASEDVKIPDLKKLQNEDAMNIFLYRNKKTYALGHGVSAQWRKENGIVSSVSTTYIPTYELLPTNTENKSISQNVLDPANYIDGNLNKQLGNLKVFIKKYEEWIQETKGNADLLPKEFKALANTNITHCKKSVERMNETLEFLKNSPSAFKAFNIANETMLLQRMKDYQKKARAYKTKNYSGVDFYWRPFQLAFILNSLESVLNPKSKHRGDLDLIWVPTGGGKTEAYLFAIAAVIAYRRLTHKHSYEGVTVIMRYTLRLLTAQQFERASKMICALEYIRKNRNDLGGSEISIGLWIGEGTENRLKNAKDDFKEMLRSNTIEDAKLKNKFQLLTCPWCGKEHSIIPREKDMKAKIYWGYKKITAHDEYNMCCLTKDCPFHKGLPIYVVDESIYRVRPTLIFGTVDKFAQVPLKEDAQKLFGSDNPKRYGRPDLIVQDELHLISGPLGSIVGLYEAGFDYILQSGENGDRKEGPKYIASTATIRNADEQVKGIFDRQVQLFPPQGITAGDNFFVREAKEGHGRKYYGIMGTGKSQMTVEVHMIAAMLQCVVGLGGDENTKTFEELYWTIACYFNSLRELGKASSLIRDDVRDYLQQLKKRFDTPNSSFRYLSDDNAKELTSRIAGNQIPNIIKELGIRHDDASSDNKHSHVAVDTLLATNMLSVGVDISRLNTMLVIGQPKLTSEYIQATSRVGRRSLGAVFTLYNTMRSRDRSHYETFQAYHQSLYKYVEPSSVTPFSVPAMQKGIPGVLVSMLRNTVESLSGDYCPQSILDDQTKQYLVKVQHFLSNRVRDSEDKYHLYEKDATNIMQSFIAKWKSLAKVDVGREKDSDYQKFAYYKYITESDKYAGNLLLKSFNDNSHPESTNVMGSMRDVEDTSYVEIKGDIEE
ncbi:DNA helicase [Lentilactobacillus fungorum]|uniref:DNA helicase n=1 Tax=Lentilactobacillus fungorum TaxID=2201250 RepID=A0ABQ3VYW4_9LACO|nr:helicase-related protein [Lentilactobacillus fungorum]GHP13918.1 DNA helicase [Lentilactobacillus fungorum]